MTVAEIDAITQHIVDDLFVNGFGEHADRLVMTKDSDPQRPLGGWSKRAVLQRVREALLCLTGTRP